MSPGKYEGNLDEALAQRLDEAIGHGFESVSFGDVNEVGGFWSLVADPQGDEAEGRWYVVHQDEQGFFDIVSGPGVHDDELAILHESRANVMDLEGTWDAVEEATRILTADEVTDLGLDPGLRDNDGVPYRLSDLTPEQRAHITEGA